MLGVGLMMAGSGARSMGMVVGVGARGSRWLSKAVQNGGRAGSGGKLGPRTESSSREWSRDSEGESGSHPGKGKGKDKSGKGTTSGMVAGKEVDSGSAPADLHPEVVDEAVTVSKRKIITADAFYDQTVRRYAAKKLRNFSINEMVGHSREPSVANILSSANFISRQLPIRLAKRIFEMQALPWLVLQNPHIYRVFELYSSSFEAIRKFEGRINDVATNEHFCETLSKALRENLPVVELLGQGVREAMQVVSRRSLHIDSFLDNMLASRITQRVMAEQHLTLRGMVDDEWRGVIHLKCSPYSRFLATTARVTEQCIQHYGVAPRVEFSGSTDIKFPFIPAHLEYIATELLKNSMRAVIEFRERSTGEVVMHASELDPIHIYFGRGDAHLNIRISDKGGGVPPAEGSDDPVSKNLNVFLGSRETIPEIKGLVPGTLGSHVFKYGVTTASKNFSPSSPKATDADARFNWDIKATNASPLAGYGFGLPLARLHARHFGGDLMMISMPGYGTDTFLSLDTTGEFYKRSL